MIINNIKTAIRNLKKRWSFALINILGLSVGLASFLILISYTAFEDSFDDFHENKENIYRIIYNSYDGKELKMTYPFVQPALGNTIKEGIEEVKLVSRFSRSNNSIVKYENVVLEENKLFYADEDFFDIFSFELLVGNSKNALKEPNSVVLTEAAALRFFGNEESVGKILKIGNDHGTHKFTVTGIVKDIPLNSSLNFDILCFFSTLNKKNGLRIVGCG